MAHDIVDVDEFTLTITVPDGTDSRNDAAEVVEALAQALANRTFALISHVAFHDSPNHFTDGSSTFDDVINAVEGISVSNPAAGEAAVTVLTSADDDPNVGNKWKNVIQQLLGGGASDASVYAGVPGGEAQLALVINAFWDPSTQQWAQQTNTQHSFALLFTYGGVATFSRVNSGEGPWATWPVTGNTSIQAQDVTLGGALAATGNVSGADISASDDLSAGDDITAGGDITATGDFLYASLRSEFKAVNLAEGVSPGTPPGITGSNSFSYFDGNEWVIGDRGNVSFPIRAPIGGTLGTTRVMIENDDPGDAVYNVSLIRGHGTVFGSTTPPTFTTVDSELDTIVAADSRVVTLSWGALAVDANETYYVQITGEVAAINEYRVQAIQFDSARPGPSRT